MFKRLALVLCVLVLAGGFVFAGGQQEAASGSSDGYVIGLSNYSLGNSWRVQMMEEARYEASINPKIKELVTTEANDDVSKQISDIEDLIARGVDAICITPMNPKALIPVVDKAVAAGIIVIEFDGKIDTDNITARVTVDQVEFGRVQGEWLAKAMGGKGKVVAFNGTKGVSISAERYEGALSVLNKYPEIEIVNEVYADWDFAKAKRAMENILASNVKIDGVWSQGGAMSEAVVKSYYERGLTIPPVTGEDGNGFLKVWKKLKDEGTGFDSIATSMPTWISAKAMQVAVDALDGKTVPKTQVIPIPTITSDTIDEYVKPELSDSFWCNSQLPDDRIKAIFEN